VSTMTRAAPDPRHWPVVRVVTRLNIGGPARHALLLTRQLADEFPTLLAVGTPSPVEGEMSDPAVRIARVPLVRPIRPAADAHALAVLRGLLRGATPRLVHTHMAKAGLVGRVAALTLHDRPRTVHTFHGHVLTGYFSRPAERAFLELERRLARRTDALVAVSTEVRDALLDLGVGRSAQFHVIPIGLDLAPNLAVNGHHGALRARLGLAVDTPLVGVVGRLVPIKDHGTLLDAIERLPGVHLAVIGDGERRGALEAGSRHAGTADRVHFTGWCNDVPAALANLDVVALSSRNEGTPVALVEALAAARPVVATDVGGVRSVVRDGVSGWLVPPGDVARLADALSRLLADPAERRRMGAAGRADVAHRFGEERLVGDIRMLYRDLLGVPA
jgi:glycosyltransferase involved in cell wall biosynthesis